MEFILELTATALLWSLLGNLSKKHEITKLKKEIDDLNKKLRDSE